MEGFQVPPEYCLIVRAIGQTSSLREAATRLSCDPTLLVRKVRTIAEDHGLLQKLHGKWTPTERGQRAAQWAEEGLTSQRAWLDAKSRLRIATTMWMAEQVLIPSLAELREQSREGVSYSFNTTSPSLERSLLDGKADYVVSCHPPTDPALAHRRVGAENWVVIVPTAWEKAFSGASPKETIERLNARPFVRHADINPEVRLGFAPALTEDTLMDSLIGVRSAVEAKLGWGCVPELLVRSALRDKKLARVGLSLPSQGCVSVWWLRARRETTRHAKEICKWLEAVCAEA